MIYIGVDPGRGGAIAAICGDSEFVQTINLDQDEHDIRGWVVSLVGHRDCRAVVERVHAMPKQGVSSTFKFGASYGFCRGLLLGLGIPFAEVNPEVWQRKLGCMTGGDKRVTRSAAGEIFPDQKVTRKNSDALLLAHFCRIHYPAG